MIFMPAKVVIPPAAEIVRVLDYVLLHQAKYFSTSGWSA